ncbi:MAG: bifunctional diaminohydroxyphosphoribosylaminopyrimidine deaminase/5-amino-6-(5-phosphoribosylamino)uracil reductase RibD [Pseudomonadota bacterium]
MAARPTVVAAAANDDDVRWMDHALGLARRGLGRVWPNPAVGCVIVSAAGHVAGRGWTQPGGRPHAEAMALAQAGDAARGATAYVSLEPCAHHGRTPPCAEALIAAGVARVVAPMIDPDPRVSGRGFAALEASQVQVEIGCRAAEAEALNASFLMRQRTGRPRLTLKLATTLDGRIATAAGESRWITGPAARRRVHLMRATHDAVLIGAGTARADDPMLDVRELGLAAAPVRVVADGSLSLPLESRLGDSAGDPPLWLAHTEAAEEARRRAWTARGAVLLATEGEAQTLDLSALLSALGSRGITRVLCEGGGRLAAGLLGAGLVDEIALFSAGRVLGSDALAAVGDLGLEALADAPGFRLTAETRIGDDTLTIWERGDD